MLRLGLRTKFFLYSNTLIVVTMTLVAYLGVTHERRTRYEAIQLRAQSLTDALAVSITDNLMNENSGFGVSSDLTDNYIQEIMRRNEDLMRYVVVANGEGVVTHSNRLEMLGRPFERALKESDIGHVHRAATRVDPGGEKVLEVRRSMGIGSQFKGSIAVGFSLEPIERQVRAVATRAVLVAVLLMVGNSALTAGYVETLIRPILNLHHSITRAARGDLSVRSRVRRRDEVGELARAFNVAMDEIERAREGEREAQAQLVHTEKMAAIGTLAAGVAHEINNPLGGVLTCIENLRSDPEDVEMRDRYLGLIDDGLRRIERIVANLLDFSRQREIRPEPTSINHNLQHVVELASYQFRKQNVQIALDLDPKEPIVLADHLQMEQLFLNLALNALQAMPDGGTLTLRTRLRKEAVIVEIQDTGVGIEPEIQERIFDPYFTTRDVGEGTGLGLAVSYSIVASHEGSMEVESTVGQGSLFRVRLPQMEISTAGKEA